ncbi:hypothetical protein ACX1G9_12920 [Yersinia enterocolitica]
MPLNSGASLFTYCQATTVESEKLEFLKDVLAHQQFREESSLMVSGSSVFEKNHADSKFIKNGIIFAVSDEESAKDASLERAKVKTGLEQASQTTGGVEPQKED